MSEAPNTPAAETTAPAPDGATDLTGAATSTDAGQGAPAGEGQGAGEGDGGKAPASAEGDMAAGGEVGDAQGAPEQYADFTLPEGVELPSDMLSNVQTFAKAHNFTQAQAQALVDLGVQQASMISEQIAAGFSAQATEKPVVLNDHWAAEWSKQTSSDAEIGGAALKDTMALAGRVFTTFASPELGKFLNDTGLAHHPELIRFMHKVGKAVSEDTLVQPTGQKPTGPTDLAKALYPNMN